MHTVTALASRPQARPTPDDFAGLADPEEIARRADQQVNALRATLAELAEACDGPSGEAFLLSEDARNLAAFARGLSRVLDSCSHELYMPF